MNEKRYKNKVTSGELIVIVISLILIAISFYFILSSPLETKTIEARFEVGKSIGFDVNSSGLIFGRLTPGSSASRTVEIENNYEFPIRINILISPELEGYVCAEPKYVLDAGELKKISFSASVPEDAKSGNYTGKVLFEFRKAG